MRQTQRRGRDRGQTRDRAGRQARRGRPGRSAAYLYRDRRRRRSRLRLLCGVLLALALAFIAALVLRLVLGSGGRPSPTVTPGPEPTAAALPEPTPEPTGQEPTPTTAPVPSVTPLTLEGMDVTEETPSAAISTRDDLIDLVRWMIDNGTNVVRLDSISLSDGEIAEVMDKYSNYLQSFGYDDGKTRMGVRFKPGVKALVALKAGQEDELEGEDLEVATRARAVVDKLITGGMTDVEKELAIHDYIAEHCEYRYDSAEKQAQSALGFFRDGQCNCAGYVDAFRLLAGLAGLDAEMIGGPTTHDAPGEKGHAWNLVRLDGLWYAVDVTWDDMLEGAAVEHAFFNLPYTAFTGYRETDSRYCPPGDYAALVDDKYYFNTPDYAAATLEDALALATGQLDAGGPAYVYFTGEDLSAPLGKALARRYGNRLETAELSEDMTLSVYRYALE